VRATENVRMPSRPSRTLVVAACCLVALAAAASALADTIQVHYTAADQAAARKAVLRSADLGAGATWTSVPAKPDVTSSMDCKGFHPKQSDLVVTGAAATEFRSTGIDFRSESHLLRAPRMLALDWQRTVIAPQVLPCLREGVTKGTAGAGTHLVSLKRVSFPRITSRTAAFRALLDVTSGGQSIRVLVDIVAMGKGRTELTLTTSAPYVALASVVSAEVRLARILAARAKA